jgi:hypothetical protein
MYIHVKRLMKWADEVAKDYKRTINNRSQHLPTVQGA